jgi:flagellar basal body-associated protein FliL
LTRFLPEKITNRMSKRNLILVGSIIVVLALVTFGYIWRGGNSSSAPSENGEPFHAADPQQDTPPPMNGKPAANAGTAGRWIFANGNGGSESV